LVDVPRLLRAAAGFFTAGWGVALLLIGILTTDRLAIAIGAAISGVILLGVSYALYRSLATEETAPRA
jgi:CHASE2 domain-containing sensor protein